MAKRNNFKASETTNICDCGYQFFSETNVIFNHLYFEVNCTKLTSKLLTINYKTHQHGYV